MFLKHEGVSSYQAAIQLFPFPCLLCKRSRKVFYRPSILTINTCRSRFLAVADRRGTNCSQAQTLSSLLASGIAGLVRVPNLLTVIAELSPAAFSSTCKFGTAGASKRDHGVS